MNKAEKRLPIRVLSMQRYLALHISQLTLILAMPGGVRRQRRLAHLRYPLQHFPFLLHSYGLLKATLTSFKKLALICFTKPFNFDLQMANFFLSLNQNCEFHVAEFE